MTSDATLEMNRSSMVKNILSSFSAAARGIWRSKAATMVCLGLFVAFVLDAYAFVAMREASVMQVIVTLLTGIAMPVLFFAYQSAAGSLASAERTSVMQTLRATRGFWKLLVASVPVIVLAWLCMPLEHWIAGSWNHAGAAATSWFGDAPQAAPRDVTATLLGKDGVMTMIRLIVFGIVIPLIAVQLWLTALREGVMQSFKHVLPVLRRALAPESMITLLIGSALFIVAPYYLMFWHIETSTTAMDLVSLAVRDIVAAKCVFLGWTITIGALRVQAERAQ